MSLKIFSIYCNAICNTFHYRDSGTANEWNNEGIIIVPLIIIDWIFSLKSLIKKEKERERERNDEWVQKSIRTAYSGAHEIFERKRVTLSRETELNRIDVKHDIFPYDIHSHIIDICQEFNKVIASITNINNELMTTTFIYRYAYDGCTKDDSRWKWIGYREPISKFFLDDFVKNEETVFYHIINDNIHYIFGNDKKELADEKMYHLGGRDEMYNNVRSIFSIKVVFGSNTTNFVEGIITVASYGKYFTEDKDKSDILRNMIIDEIFLYYRKLLETELGLLYVRHILE